MAQTGAKEITLTVEDLDRLVERRVKEAIVDTFKKKDPDDSFRETLESIRGQDKRGPEVTLIQRRSPETGATFTLELQRGRVVTIRDYAYPPGAEEHVQYGGLLPDGIEKVNQTTGMATTQYKQWKWETFWKADLKRLIGKSKDMAFRLTEAIEPPQAA